jgi:hypothetical protein
MELLYFISGILTVGVLYGIRLLRTVKSSHTDLLARYQSQSNISSIRYGDLSDDLKTVEDLVMDISSKMEKDQYAALSEINKEISEVTALADSTNNRLGDTDKKFTNNIRDILNEIQQLKVNVKALGEDPNFLSKY